MDPFADRLHVLQSESERIKQYLHALPLEALQKPSACTQWQVQDVIAHLIGVAETYASSVSRGLQGDTGPPPGRLPAGQATASLSAEGIAQRSIAARQTLGEALLATFDAANDRLNSLLAGLQPAQRSIPCYHPGGIVQSAEFYGSAAQRTGCTRVGYPRGSRARGACVTGKHPGHYDHDLRIDRVRLAQMGLLVRAAPDDTSALSLCGDRTGARQIGHRGGEQHAPHGRCRGDDGQGHHALRYRDLCTAGLWAPQPGGRP